MSEEDEAIEYLENSIKYPKTSEIYVDYEYRKRMEEILLNLIKSQKEEIEKQKDTINKDMNRLAEKQIIMNKLETIAGLALKRKPLAISKRMFKQLLENNIEIEQIENIQNDSYIFKTR